MTKTNKDKEDSAKTEDQPKKKLSLGGGTLSLKGGSGGSARQSSAPPGSITVEVRRKRVTAPEAETPTKAKEDLSLTNNERQARFRALEQAQQDGNKGKSSLPKRRTTIEDKKRQEAEEKQKEEADQSARDKELEELRRIDEAEKPAVPESALPGEEKPDAAKASKFKNSPDAESYRDKIKKAAKPAPKRTQERVSKRITVTQALNRDYERDRGPSLAAQKRAREKARMAAKSQGPAKKVLHEVTLPEVITVQELANRMAEPARDVVKALMKLGVMATINESIDADTAELIIEELGHTSVRVTDADVEIGLDGVIDDDDTNLEPRPPVVTIMGHVDHGKTSLLDALRQTDVVAGEAGGITQHIGAYQVTMESGNKITFLDTPGHAAFTEMRARGANVTDIVIIVVSAEDSVMPQTIEAINHAKAAEVPIIIAINKIDLPGADPAKIRQDLLQYEVIVEDLGGDVQCVEVSAKAKTNLDILEETILLQAEILELKANPNREAHGFVVEAKMEKGRGSVATVLIQRGTLRIGDIFVAGAVQGKVRAIINDHGTQVDLAIPGQPVEVLGINDTPNAGDQLDVVEDEAKAREIAEYRQQKTKNTAAAAAIKGRVTIEDLLLEKEVGEKTVLPVLVKADVHGSIEAIIGSFNKMEEDNEGIAVQVLHTGVGGITESDVTLARASNAMLIGFNVRANAQARDLAQKESVQIRYYNVIYNVIDDTKAILTGMLSPLEREEYLGQAEILEVFNITGIGKIAGCMVKTGSVKRGSKVRLLRDDVVIHEGMLKTLKRFKDEVKDVKEGTECGMAFETYDDLKKGDIIECFEVIEEAREVT